MTLIALLALTAQTLISAVTFLVAKRGLAELSPGELCLARFAAAAVLFALALVLSGRSLLPPRGRRLQLVWLGLLAFPANQGFFLVGLASTTPSHASFMYALAPALVLLAAAVTGRERFTLAKGLGVGLAITGVVLVVLDRGASSAMQPSVGGDALVLCAAAAWALYTLQAGAVAKELGALAASSWALLWGALASLPFAPLLSRPPGELAQVSATAWACVAFLAAFSSFAGYALWNVALRTVEASRAAVFTNLQPVLTALLSAALLGERLGPAGIAGGAVVLAGVAWTQRAAAPLAPSLKSASK